MHAKIDAVAAGLPVRDSGPKTRSRFKAEMKLRIGQVDGDILDTCFPLFSVKRIKEQSKHR